jgi:hypothetical protein
MRCFSRQWFGAFCAAVALFAHTAFASDTLAWRAKQNRIDADIKNLDLSAFLQKLSATTGWEVYVEPGTSTTISSKFNNLPSDEALRRLLGKINYARSAETNALARSVTKLFVYKTTASAATQLIQSDLAINANKLYRIADELIVRLSPNSKMSIEELAKMVGATIVSRDDALKLYRLKFDSATAADAARAMLEGMPDVASVDSNYRVDPPKPFMTAGGGSLMNPPPPGEGGATAGLIDTGVQTQNCYGSDYSLPAISVAGLANLPTDSPTHGTGMYETLIRSMGNAPSRIRPVDVYGPNGSTTTYEVVQGIIKAVNSGANPINLSLGGTGDSDLLHRVINEGYNKGIVFVGAAGNEPGTTPTFPAAYREVLAVTAIGPDGQIAPYANTGNFVDMKAPGSSVVCLNGQNWMVQGTSVSTAVVTGRIVELMNLKHITAREAARLVLAGQR